MTDEAQLPAIKNFSIWRGNTFRRKLRFKANGQPVAFPADAVFTWTITWRNGRIVKTTSDSTLAFDAAQSELALFLSVADTRSLPANVRVSYEVELKTADDQTTYVAGAIVARGGLNSD